MTRGRRRKSCRRRIGGSKREKEGTRNHLYPMETIVFAQKLIELREESYTCIELMEMFIFNFVKPLKTEKS